MLKIETWKNNEILRAISEEIKKSELKEYIKLWEEMIKYIKNPKNWWIWLAAPQIWYNKRLIVVSLLKDREDESFKTVMMINPKIVDHSDKKVLDTEWCLSVPWEKWKVKRYNEIKLKYIDDKWKENKIILEWLRARIVQHEIDHLDWILFTDRLW
jgi:peptide deformylase